jgi:hypothetical protein
MKCGIYFDSGFGRSSGRQAIKRMTEKWRRTFFYHMALFLTLLMAETPGFKSKVSGRALYCGADNSRVVSNCELFFTVQNENN